LAKESGEGEKKDAEKDLEKSTKDGKSPVWCMFFGQEVERICV